MPCNVARYQDPATGTIAWGVVQDGLYPIEGSFETTADFLRHGKDKAFAVRNNLPNLETQRLPVEQVKILSPVTKPCQVLCQGANYRQHMIESGMNPDAKSFNMFFNKSAASLSAPDAEIQRPAHVQLLDYEIELGLVIGADLHHAETIAEADLPRYIAGIVIGNDVSARDVQVPQMQFFKGKSYRSFCPVGPYLCLLEEADFRYLSDLELRLSVNGEDRQRDNTSGLVFKPAETLTEMSQVADLNLGDLVLTGTPAGCAMQAPPPAIVKLMGLLPDARKWKLFIKAQTKRRAYLQPDDIVEAHIASADGVIDLGTQRNRVVAA